MFHAAQGLDLPIDEKAYTNMISYYGKAGWTYFILSNCINCQLVLLTLVFLDNNKHPSYILSAANFLQSSLLHPDDKHEMQFFHRNNLFLFTGFAGRTEEALQLFEKMKEVGIQPGKVCNQINNLIVTKCAFTSSVLF